ncbi:bifunctional helix-turn-helix transcriptional regulator/GNAT family N-acetyltransferase [Streptomyces kanamyceticus]|uniref:MarR family transcriptional regulator n=1 Tax=Streptomyces kanamyceticus TaxID=1967 RepID=A0A5J6GMI5_STRKN|nr:bifunctional helix-turn-helix transcriptional regulator/GNAT family N-acetyltransferase [Streptomyces kanamyceticus]QEU94246.1 MarR family transcriptional regulator [Streptomyces kanamyceticus]
MANPSRAVRTPIHEIRAFNRFYTNLIGALDYSRHLYVPYTLTESRVLYELAHAPHLDAADLRSELSLDAGYLSRLLGKFERAGLVERAPSAPDPRRQRITLTARGRDAADLLDERSREAVGSLVADVPAAERERLAAAMRTVRGILEGAAAGSVADSAADSVRPSSRPRQADLLLREPGPGDLGWIVQRNAAVYAAEFGWNADYEGLVARLVADFAQDHDPHLERVWIAELDGRPVGCVMCVRDEAPGTARLRLLLVERDARGLGLGDQLIGACVEFARGVGYRDLVLWTNDVLEAARTLYQRHGFVLVAEKPHRSFGADLVGQDWRLPLHERRRG